MLSAAQHEAVKHGGGPLLVIGGAGTGKTTTLVERFAWLAERPGDAVPAESILVLTPAADALRERIEERLGRPASEEPAVTTFQGLCARVLHDEALEAGVDPFATPVSPADRLAMLLERIEELPLRHHDLRGNPSAVLGSIVGRIDRLKDELVTCEDYAAWASTLGEAEGARAAREREFGELFRAHDRMLRDAGTLDFGDLVLLAFRLLREKPHVRARLAGRYRHVLVDDLQDTSFAQGLLLRLLVADRGEVTAAGDDDQSIQRFRGASTKAFADFEAEWPGDPGRPAGGVLPRRRADRRGGGRRRRAGAGPARQGAAPARPARRARWRSGRARPSARRRRPSRPRSSG